MTSLSLLSLSSSAECRELLTSIRWKHKNLWYLFFAQNLWIMPLRLIHAFGHLFYRPSKTLVLISTSITIHDNSSELVKNSSSTSVWSWFQDLPVNETRNKQVSLPRVCHRYMCHVIIVKHNWDFTKNCSWNVSWSGTIEWWMWMTSLLFALKFCDCDTVRCSLSRVLLTKKSQKPLLFHLITSLRWYSQNWSVPVCFNTTDGRTSGQASVLTITAVIDSLTAWFSREHSLC